jgi:hypothetical protein
VVVKDSDDLLAVYKASSISGTWTIQDSTPSVPSSGTLNVSTTVPFLSTFLDSTGIIHCLYVSSSGAASVHCISTFDTTSDSWYDYGSSTYHTEVDSGGTTDYDYSYGTICELGNGNIVAVFDDTPEAYHGDSKLRISYAASTDNGQTWGSATSLDDGGDVHYGNPTCAPGATSTEFHCYAQRQTSTANDPPTSWADTWLTGNTSPTVLRLVVLPTILVVILEVFSIL